MSNDRFVDRNFILSVALRLKPGQMMNINRDKFLDAFRTGLDGRPPIDDFLEQMPGANYGTYTAEWSLDHTHVKVRRFEEGGVKVREDWDRR